MAAVATALHSSSVHVATVPVMSSQVLPAACPISFVTTKSSPWGGGCPWQYDKTSFKNWCTRAVNGPANSKDRKELYGFLAECFLDADCDRDGQVGADEFDFLIERAASLPRRFGLAPSWTECYGDVAGRNAARKEMFRQMDRTGKGLIGMEEWVEFSMTHIAEKVSTMRPDTVDFAALERSSQEEFVSFLECAMQNQHSEEFKALYEHLFKTFVEKDVMIKGAINFQEFDLLIEEAAKAPRTLGLAPSAAQAYASPAEKLASRQQLFDSMDKDKGGNISFDEYLAWAVGHIAQKIQEYRAGNRYHAPPAPVAAYAAPAVTYSAAPVTCAAPPVTYTAPASVVHAGPVRQVSASQTSVAYAAAPAAPVAYAASPTTFVSHAAAPVAYSAAPVTIASSPRVVHSGMPGMPTTYVRR